MSLPAELVLMRLRDGAAPVPVHDGSVPDLPEYPYVVLWMGGPSRGSDRLTRLQVNHTLTWQTSCVALTSVQARALQQRVQDSLTDLRLILPGRSAARVQHAGASVPYADLDVDPEVLIAADTWSLFTAPYGQET